MAIELTQEIGRLITTIRHRRNNIFDAESLVRGSPEGECGLLPKYFSH